MKDFLSSSRLLPHPKVLCLLLRTVLRYTFLLTVSVSHHGITTITKMKCCKYPCSFQLKIPYTSKHWRALFIELTMSMIHMLNFQSPICLLVNIYNDTDNEFSQKQSKIFKLSYLFCGFTFVHTIYNVLKLKISKKRTGFYTDSFKICASHILFRLLLRLNNLPLRNRSSFVFSPELFNALFSILPVTIFKNLLLHTIQCF